MHVDSNSFSKAFAQAIADNETSLTSKTVSGGTADGLTPGYWLVIENDTANGHENSAPIFMPYIDVPVTVNEKSSTVTVTKEITNGDADNVKHTDVSIGDTVSYKLTGRYADMTRTMSISMCSMIMCLLV